MAQPSVRITWCCFLTSLCLSLMMGCGGDGGPRRDYAEVTGMVKYKGKPAADASVVFQPASGAPVIGKVGADGAYKIQGVIGPNTVMIKNPVPPAPAAAADIAKNKAAMAEHEKAIKDAKILPDKYSSAASGLSFEVKAGKNQKDFELE